MNGGEARARRAWVESHLRRHCFTAPPAGSVWPIFGAELEMLALDSATGRPARIDSGAAGTLALVRAAAPALGWRETRSSKGTVQFVGEDGGTLTFEPGGQLEYASRTHHALHALWTELREVSSALREAAGGRGITLLSCGIDPLNGAEAAALQLRGERYRRMDAHFARIGPAGARMMRQTASLQLCIGGVNVATRWPLANALAPWLVALFANSRQYAGHDSGCASYRAESWRAVDPSRTGVMAGDDAVHEYASFALAATAILAGPEGRAAAPFAELPADRLDDAALDAHLSTLFPEVRPRGYLELRSCDAVPDEQVAPALVLAAGLLADEKSAHQASALLGAADPALLVRAGREGAHEPTIARHADDLFGLALEGCARLGDVVVDPAMRELARESRSRGAGAVAHAAT